MPFSRPTLARIALGLKQKGSASMARYAITCPYPALYAVTSLHSARPKGTFTTGPHPGGVLDLGGPLVDATTRLITRLLTAVGSLESHFELHSFYPLKGFRVALLSTSLLQLEGVNLGLQPGDPGFLLYQILCPKTHPPQLVIQSIVKALQVLSTEVYQIILPIRLRLQEKIGNICKVLSLEPFLVDLAQEITMLLCVGTKTRLQESLDSNPKVVSACLGVVVAHRNPFRRKDSESTTSGVGGLSPSF